MSFDILSPDCPIFSSMAIEASAGTGKTFAIEHLFVRLLLDKSASVDEIAVVTFTNKAAKELLLRISSRLDQSVRNCTNNEQREILVSALQHFHRARISTIHTFCARALNRYGNFTNHETSVCFDELYAHFTSGRLTKKLTTGQVVRLLQSYKDPLELCENLLEALTSKHAEGGPSFLQHAKSLKEILKPNPCFANELAALAKAHKGCCHKDGLYTVEFRYAAKIFEEGDLDFLCASTSWLGDFIHPSQQKSHFDSAIFETCLWKAIESSRQSIETLRHLPHLFNCVLETTQELLSHHKISYDSILKDMFLAVQNPSFQKTLVAETKIILIDEFQDTDEKSWGIFETLKDSIRLFIVGDPKQSIYRFRSADIYSYMNAATSFGEKNCAYLDRNFRSSPDLIYALNFLFFTASTCPFPLPRENKQLLYHLVKAARHQEGFFDGKNAFEIMHFVDRPAGPTWPRPEFEKTHIFPHIAKEILLLDCPLHEIAILVKDRYSAQRCYEVLKSAQIQAHIAGNTEEDFSFAALNLKAFFMASLDREKLYFLENSELFALTDTSKMHDLISHIGNILLSSGPFPALNHALQMTWPGHKDCLEKELSERKGGKKLLFDCLDLTALLQDQHPFASSYHLFDAIEQNRFFKGSLAKGSGVNILTLHASKGLEFRVCFATSLTARSKKHSFEDCLSEAELKEKDAEKMRLLYVALTRAKDRVYCVCVSRPQRSKSTLSLGSASPLDLFWAQMQAFSLQRLTWDWEGMYRELSSFDTHTLSMLFDSFSESKIGHRLYEKPPEPFSEVQEQKETFFTQNISMPIACENRDALSQSATSASLEFGIAIHKLLDAFPYEKTWPDHRKSDVFAIVKDLIHNSFLEAHTALAQEIVWNALHSTLDAPKPFCLASVAPQKRRSEIDFMYCDEEHSLKRGCVDLLVEHESGLYIIDWKSNELSTYSKTELLRIVKNQYFTQAKAYCTACEKYLEQFPSLGSKHLKGIIFVFVRGIHPNVSGGISDGTIFFPKKQFVEPSAT